MSTEVQGQQSELKISHSFYILNQPNTSKMNTVQVRWQDVMFYCAAFNYTLALHRLMGSYWFMRQSHKLDLMIMANRHNVASRMAEKILSEVYLSSVTPSIHVEIV